MCRASFKCSLFSLNTKGTAPVSGMLIRSCRKCFIIIRCAAPFSLCLWERPLVPDGRHTVSECAGQHRGPRFKVCRAGSGSSVTSQNPYYQWVRLPAISLEESYHWFTEKVVSPLFKSATCVSYGPDWVLVNGWNHWMLQVVLQL